ncbi:OLC1v1024011C1 [Oldenlandia corymbosa var. corymbosa]|uniref:OLC1v1024011C1 n=1 Tax=Oldenlandia corymbosa var. corymbosa TaxID=529605 RepID=A0AAV1C452_OLDCO|nr:OLC1v1024011C1 [Oldenlandia corymbosa var. corymbosa]
MTDRYFPNQMPDFVEEDPTLQQECQQADKIPEPGTEEALLRLLATPYAAIHESLKRAALDLKETIVVETWGLTGQKVHDFTLYSGVLGTAFLLFKSYQVTHNANDLSLCSHIVKACDFASFYSRDVTFICGRAGVCALGAAVAKNMGDDQMVYYYLSKLKEIRLSSDLPDELLYGRCGYLWACQFINRHLGKETISLVEMGSVIKEIIGNGRNMGGRGRSPLMSEWYGERYWGAAHGLAGIMHVLMDFELKPDECEDVKETLKYMIKNRFQSGNYPVSEEDRQRDVLVHWCHGAPGIALTLVKAAEVFGDKVFLQAAIDAADVVWNRGLLKRVGICHGISGNSYVFLALYRLTGEVRFLYRAKAFSCFLLDRSHKLISEGEMHGGDSRYSLFEGIGGMAYLFLDMVHPTDAKFPAYEL